jgi:hypothetical protein
MVDRSVQRRETMGAERLLISVFNATRDITAALSALLLKGFALHREHERPLASQFAAFPRPSPAVRGAGD